MEPKSTPHRDAAQTPANPAEPVTSAAAARPNGVPHTRHKSHAPDEDNPHGPRGEPDPARGTIQTRGKRAIMMTEEAYTLLLQVIYEHAPQIIKYAFYDMGYRAGIDIMSALAEQIRDPNEAFRRFVGQYQDAGYGRLDVVHFDAEAPEAHIRGTDLFEAGLAPKAGIYRSPRAVDHYSRGIFAGFMSELLHREVVCEEIACQFRGDPYCEFVVLPFQA